MIQDPDVDMRAAAAASTRAQAVQRLAAFVPRAGGLYAGQRNFDNGPGERANVSMLSPAIRHRLITEQEVVAAVLARHSPMAAEKFVQQVCWRTYWKGWLELRPQVWHHFQQDVTRLRNQAGRDGGLADRIRAAETGATGLACFDAWARELVETGYLHNHTRMWFASIWVYTLELPWQSGADFFMRHLLDGDPASNTLSWRWVCGLQTAGKTYLARADNIETYTKGRFAPHGALALEAPAVRDDFEMPRPGKLEPADSAGAGERSVLFLTEDDLNPESWPVGRGDVAAVVGVRTASAYPGVSGPVVDFKTRALADAMARAQSHFGCPVLVVPAERGDGASAVMELAVRTSAAAVATMHLPVGPATDAARPVLAAVRAVGWPVRTLRRRWDGLFWPHATHGFFKLKEKIPAVLAELDMAGSEMTAAPELPFA